MGGQHLRIGIGPVGGCPEQNNDISELRRTVGPLFLVPDRIMTDNLKDPGCGHLRLRMHRVRKRLLSAFRAGFHNISGLDKDQLRPADRLLLPLPRLRIWLEHRTRIQGFIRPVGDAPDLPPHDLPEDQIHGLKHLSSGAEVLMQIDSQPAGLLRLPNCLFLNTFLSFRTVFLFPIAFILFHENTGIGHPEPVDALLDISHHEAVVHAPALPGYARQKQLLDLIGILVLVDGDLLKVVLVLPRCLCRYDVPILILFDEHLQCKMGSVREIQNILSGFLLGESLLKAVCQPDKDGKIRSRPLHQLRLLREWTHKIFLPEASELFLPAVPKARNHLHLDGIVRLLPLLLLLRNSGKFHIGK